jgi:hypothetical protein
VQLLPDRTDATFPRLFFLQSLLEKIFQQIQFFSAGLIGTNIEPKELALMLKNIRLKYLIQ